MEINHVVYSVWSRDKELISFGYRSGLSGSNHFFVCLHSPFSDVFCRCHNCSLSGLSQNDNEFESELIITGFDRPPLHPQTVYKDGRRGGSVKWSQNIRSHQLQIKKTHENRKNIFINLKLLKSDTRQCWTTGGASLFCVPWKHFRCHVLLFASILFTVRTGTLGLKVQLLLLPRCCSAVSVWWLHTSGDLWPVLKLCRSRWV